MTRKRRGCIHVSKHFDISMVCLVLAPLLCLKEQDLEVDSFDTVLTGVDTDGDGVLSIDELISQDPSMDAATKLLLKRAFEEADQNGDRRIDDDEMGDFLREVDEALSLRSEQEQGSGLLVTAMSMQVSCLPHRLSPWQEFGLESTVATVSRWVRS